MAPHAFLPLACSANLAKNLAAVAASSTRAPIYRTFALQNNLVSGWGHLGAKMGARQQLYCDKCCATLPDVRLVTLFRLRFGV